MPAGRFKIVRVRIPVGGVTGEEASEDEEFRGEEHPHAQQFGIALLLKVVKLVGQEPGVGRQFPFPLLRSTLVANSCKVPWSQLGSFRSYPWAAARESAIPDRSPSTD